MAGTSNVGIPNDVLMALGVTESERHREFHTVVHGRWLPNENRPSGADHRIRQLFFAAPIGSVLSHESAIRWYGLPGDRRRDADRLHVTIPSGSCLDRREFATHVAHVPFDDTANVRGLLVTSPERTFLDLAASMDRERLVVVGDAMLAARLTTRDALEVRIAKARRARGVRLARELVGLLDGRAQSPPESILRLRFHDARLPAPQPQCSVDAGFAVLHVDLGWDEYRVGVEYEGRQHAEVGQFGLDVDRYSALSARGWLILRASSRDLAAGSHTLIKRTRAALRERGAPI